MIILDDGIAENLVAGIINLLAHRFDIPGNFNFQILADMHPLDSFESHMFQRVLYCFALWVNHRLFWCNRNFCFHLDTGFCRKTECMLKQAYPTFQTFLSFSIKIECN